MTHPLELKQAAFDFCKSMILKRIQTIEAVLLSLEESRSNESKSSVGDKYETGRTMLQLEEEKNKTQLLEALAAKSVLESVQLGKPSEQVSLGSFICTNTGNYFIAIGVGKIHLDGEIIYGISLDSPIGQALKQKRAGEEVIFNNRRIEIQAIF